MSARAPDRLAAAYHRSLALRWSATVLAMPVLVPLLLARGLDLAQVALVMATFAAVAAVLEVPTGGLADAFGRVRVTLVADACALLARLAFMLAPGLAGLLAAAALGGAARALGSGALEAWYVDARRARDPSGDLQGPLARAGTVTSLVLAGGTLAGGALPLAAPVLGLAAPGEVGALQFAFAVSATLWVASLAVTARLPEARAHTPEARHAARRAARPDRVARVAVGALARDPALVPLLAIGAAFGAVVMSFETFLPAELRLRWGPEGVSMVLGTVMTVAFGATAAGQALAARFAAKDPRVPLARVAQGALVVAVGVGLVALDPGTAARPLVVAFAAVGAWLGYLGLGFAGPALGAAFHDRVASAERATMLSVHSLAAYLGGVAATLALGAAAGASGLAAVWIAAAALAGAAAFTALAWRGRRAEHLPSEPTGGVLP
jgi:MFS family permease